MTTAVPLVSIILPTYNGMPYLREAVESVRAQTFRNWELIVIDDGSSDDSVTWLASIDDPRIHVLKSEHTGQRGRLRNRGLGVARGEWIAFNDSDDRWRPEKLERQLAYHAEHPELRWSYTGRAVIDRTGRLRTHPPDRWVPHQGRILTRLLRFEAAIALPSVLVSRSLLEQVGGFWDHPWGEDYELWVRLAQQVECGLIDEPLVEIRAHHSTSAGRPEVPRAYMQVYGRVMATTNDPIERGIARRERVRQGVRMANTLIGKRELRPAFAALFQALQRRPFDPGAWRTLLRGSAVFARSLLGQSRSP
jgi:glycosyltransferase involved in cell wall biosynthesis